MSNIDFRFMDRKEVTKLFKISRSTLERAIADGEFPKPYQTGKRGVRWRSDEIKKHIDTLKQVDAYACLRTKEEK